VNMSLVPLVGRVLGAKICRRMANGMEGLAGRLEAVKAITSAQREILARNAVFAGRHKGRRAFVIVNGPSLKHQDLMPLENEVTFVVSSFWKHPVVEQWQPTYYCILDKAFFEYNERTAAFYKELNGRIKASKLFFPLFRGYDAHRKYGLVNPERAYYVACIRGVPFPSVDMTGVVQSFAGVSAFALSLALYMECSPIYLLGFDHDYLANRGPDHHFYEGSVIEDPHVAAANLADRIPYDVEMESNLRLWRNYRSLAAIAAKKGLSIYNATLGGFLDVFPRANYAALFTGSAASNTTVPAATSSSQQT
jgi:hypothetical protein